MDGDLDYVRQMWPVITRHLAWEKLNYDPDNDGLYDAYACIWASDALYYNSGAVTHSSVYNYRANKTAAQLAEKIGEDPTPTLPQRSRKDSESHEREAMASRTKDIGRNIKILWVTSEYTKVPLYGPFIML